VRAVNGQQGIVQQNGIIITIIIILPMSLSQRPSWRVN